MAQMLSIRKFWDDPYQVHLEIFSGPLDLLLYLIQRDELDIYDIPIARITSEFLEYVERMQELDIEGVGDFLVMAATLMRIKAQSLLPSAVEEEEEVDLRQELTRQLLEYRFYREVARALAERLEAQGKVFFRKGGGDREGEELKEASPFDLALAFLQLTSRAPEPSYREVQAEEVSLEERIAWLESWLELGDRWRFRELMGGLDRLVLIVSFFALLELIRLGRVIVRPAGEGDLWILRR
ncbi:MAG: chromosome segregation protein ScpA [Candidatus Latescibacterota bacterium]|nr:MAG: chromosome segregation protein ScpA [Candidatus Latescibacterota bacterium]